MRINPILNTDSYKLSHFKQYPPGTEYIYSYIESRGGQFERTLFFGLQAFIKEYLQTPITLEDIYEAAEFAKLHNVPFNYEGWRHIIYNHDGYLPVEIHAVPEGSLIPNHNVLLTIVNTDPKVPWITSYVETALLRAIWYPSTVATNSWYMKKHIMENWLLTSDADISQIDYKLVDFGARGVSSEESAGLGGMAHLVNFKVTDTISGILAAKRYYHEKMAGYSIPAAEHSTITAWGKESEYWAYRNMIDKFGGQDNPAGAYAVVSDSYDIMNAVNNIWGDELKDKVLANPNTLVIRPDSGDPTTMPIRVVQSLASRFGYTTNSKGYKVLNDKVRVIQGDGIDVYSLPRILMNLRGAGFAAENLTFGMGGGLLQHCNRDSQKFAMKCSAAYVDGEWRDVFKEAPGKESKRGRLALIKDVEGNYRTVEHDGNAYSDILRLVYHNGYLMIDEDFQTIRNRARGIEV